MSQAERMRVGIAGCGGLAGGFRLPAYSQAVECELIAFYDVDVRRARALRDRYRVRLLEIAQTAAQSGDEDRAAYYRHHAGRLEAHDDYAAMLDAVDGVDIITPPPFHVPLARQALQAGRAVLIEKPLARTWWEAAQLRDAVDASKGVALYAENFLFMQTTLGVRQLVEAGVVGAVQHVTCRLLNRPAGFRRPVPDLPQPERDDWRSLPYVGGGGALIDLSIHTAAAAWFIAGFDLQPTRVRSAGIEVAYRTVATNGKAQPVAVDDDSTIEVLLEQPHTRAWATLSVQSGGNLRNAVEEGGPGNWLIVHGSDGELRLMGDWFRGTSVEVQVRRTRGGVETYHLQTPHPRFIIEGHHREVRHLAACWRDGQASLITYDLGMEMMAVVGAAYLSEVRGRVPVTPDEFREWSNTYGADRPDEERVRAQLDHLLAPYRV